MTIRRQVPPLAALLVAAAVFGTAACSSSESDDPPAAGTSAAATPGGVSEAAPGQQPGVSVQHVDPKAFAAAVGQSGTVVLDVRTPDEYASGHIDQAVNIDIQAADFAQRLAGLDKAATYAVYCRSGNRSGVAAEQMRAAGFTKIIDLAGGVIAWTEAGNKLVTG